VAQARFRDVETGTVLVIFETDSPEQYTEFIRDVAPQLTTLLSGQPATAVERVWNRVTDAYRPRRRRGAFAPRIKRSGSRVSSRPFPLDTDRWPRTCVWAAVTFSIRRQRP